LLTKANPFWPQPFLLRHVAVRAAVVWVLLHGIIFAVSGGTVILLAWRASIVLTIVAAWLGYVDASQIGVTVIAKVATIQTTTTTTKQRRKGSPSSSSPSSATDLLGP